MRVKVCGCYGGETLDTALTGFVVDGALAVDAGSITRSCTLEEQQKIRNILITHTHLDHIKDLAFLSDNLIGMISEPITIWSIAHNIEVIKTHLMNDKIWPDFSKLPTPEKPTIRFQAIEEEKPFKVEGYTCFAVRTNHPVPNVGYLIQDKKGTFCFSGDTGVTEKLWKTINERKDMLALITEVSFPNNMDWLADVSGHLTPKRLKTQMDQLRDRKFKLYLSHMKPNFVDVLKQEVAAEGIANHQFLRVGEILEL
ncbi:MAG: 3',5'-cyclic-nucleotide phosphodiesterase [Bdellovibrionota bacterium]